MSTYPDFFEIEQWMDLVEERDALKSILESGEPCAHGNLVAAVRDLHKQTYEPGEPYTLRGNVADAMAVLFQVAGLEKAS